MNPHLCRIALRPRGPLEVFDLSLRLLATHAGRFVRLGALFVLPPALAGGLVVSLTELDWLVLLLLPLIFFPLQAPATILGGRLLFADTISIRAVLRELAGMIRPLGLAWLWQAGALSLGVGCGFVPLVILLPVTAYVTETSLLERVGAARSFRRSARLAGSNPGIALAASAGWVGLTAWGALVAESGGQALVGFVLQLGQPFGSLFGGQITPYLLFGALAIQPVYAIYRLLLYVDVRTRVEGWDLQVGLRAAGLEER